MEQSLGSSQRMCAKIDTKHSQKIVPHITWNDFSDQNLWSFIKKKGRT